MSAASRQFRLCFDPTTSLARHRVLTLAPVIRPVEPGAIETYVGDPPDGKKTCVVEISKEDFVLVYRGGVN
jgi:hypothetical protein